MVGVPAVLLALTGGIMGSPVVDKLVFAREEASVGRAPNGPTGERENTFTNELAFGAGIGLRSRRNTFELTLGPRFYYRVPNLPDLNRPLVLGLGSVRDTYVIDPRWQWITNVNGEYGEVEYSSAHLVTDSPVSRPEEASVIRSLDVLGDTGFAFALTRVHTLSLAAVGGYTRPVGTREGNPVETTTTGGANFSERWTYDRRTTLSTPFTLRYYSIVESRDWMVATQSLGYDRVLGRKTSLSSSLGATLLQENGEPPRVLPRGLFAVQHVVRETRQSRYMNRFAVFADASFDPLLGTVYPLSGAEASLAIDFAERWTAVASVNGYTPLTLEPVTPEGIDTELDATGWVSYRLSREWTFDTGVRESTRATHLSVSPFTFRSGETWVFARVSFALSSRAGAAGH
jgi:hypothetical protein